MHHLIDSHLQQKAILYEKKKDVLNILRLLISGTYLSAFYISGLSHSVSGMAATYTMPLAIILYILFLTPLTIILFPISFRRDYVIEKRFGLSSQSFKSWFFDQVKSFILGFILGYPLILLLFFLFTHTPRYWWIFGVLGMFLFQLVITILFPVLIFPIFFKQKPIRDEELIQRINMLMDSAHMKIEGIYSFNLSLKTKKENAVLAGLWKTRRVLLADTLLKNRNIEEIIVVLAHEIGHHLKRHICKLSLLGTAASFILFFAVNKVMILFPGFPENFQETLSLFPLFILISGILSFPIKMIINAYARLKEREADFVAIELTKNKDAFIGLMAGLANSNLLVAYPKKLKIILSYSHPSIGQRIELAQ
ncbi:Protease HtpX [subsurface metagenome]